MDSASLAKNWYVAYTFPNAEKSVQRTLERMHITSFLPLCEVIRRWSDRRKKILSPIFPNYIFIYSSNYDRYKALRIKGIIKYVVYNGKPAIMKSEQIESIRKLLNGDVEIHPNGSFRPGDRVVITQGPFTGVEGTLQKINGNTRLVVQINCLNRAISISISANMVSAFTT